MICRPFPRGTAAHPPAAPPGRGFTPNRGRVLRLGYLLPSDAWETTQ